MAVNLFVSQVPDGAMDVYLFLWWLLINRHISYWGRPHRASSQSLSVFYIPFRIPHPCPLSHPIHHPSPTVLFILRLSLFSFFLIPPSRCPVVPLHQRRLRGRTRRAHSDLPLRTNRLYRALIMILSTPTILTRKKKKKKRVMQRICSLSYLLPPLTRSSNDRTTPNLRPSFMTQIWRIINQILIRCLLPLYHTEVLLAAQRYRLSLPFNLHTTPTLVIQQTQLLAPPPCISLLISPLPNLHLLRAQFLEMIPTKCVEWTLPILRRQIPDGAGWIQGKSTSRYLGNLERVLRKGMKSDRSTENIGRQLPWPVTP